MLNLKILYSPFYILRIFLTTLMINPYINSIYCKYCMVYENKYFKYNFKKYNVYLFKLI